MKIEPITVSYLNKYIKEKVAEDEYLNNVYVRGEISNFKHHYTGHMYFTLKDEGSLIKCIMFKSSTATLNFTPKDGMKVFFDNSHKQKIPFMPKTIGVLTSKTGSVIKDIINVSTRRNPNVHIRLFPIPVQGKGAELEIADAIRIMNEKKLADVLILARGGGSIEDLWPFNEEITARAIYNSKIPIISAVGHETDFTIADFVADLRAPTPSAAAELAVPDIEEIKRKLETYNQRYKTSLKKKIEFMKLRYQKCMSSKVFTDPTAKIKEQYINLDIIIKNLENLITNKVKDSKTKSIELISKLDTLSPLKTLTRGYSIVQKDGKTIKSVKELKTNDMLGIRFTDGEIKTKVLWGENYGK